jgi:hypothetical protein
MITLQVQNSHIQAQDSVLCPLNLKTPSSPLKRKQYKARPSLVEKWQRNKVEKILMFSFKKDDKYYIYCRILDIKREDDELGQLGFVIENDTQKAIFEMKRFMNNVSRERIRDEFTKIIMSENPMIGLMMTQKLGILEFIAPVLENMVGVDQNKQAHLYDVWEQKPEAKTYFINLIVLD